MSSLNFLVLKLVDEWFEFKFMLIKAKSFVKSSPDSNSVERLPVAFLKSNLFCIKAAWLAHIRTEKKIIIQVIKRSWV